MRTFNRTTLLVLVLVSVWLGGCGAQSVEQPTAALPASPAAESAEPESKGSSTDQAVVEPTVQPTEAPPDEPATSGDLSPAGVLAAKLEGLDLDEFFEVSFRELTLRDPEAVLEEGLADVYGVETVELTNISDAYVRETQQMYATVLDALQIYDRDALTPEQQISYDVYEWYLDDQVRSAEFMYNDYPATYFFVTAVHEQIIQFFTDLHPIADKQDAEDYVARLGQVDTKFEQLLEGLELREKAGIVPPQFASQWAIWPRLTPLVLHFTKHSRKS